MNDLEEFKRMLADQTETDLSIREANRQLLRELQDAVIWSDLQSDIIDAPSTKAYYDREFPILLDNGWFLPLEVAVDRFGEFKDEVIAMARKELGL